MFEQLKYIQVFRPLSGTHTIMIIQLSSTQKLRKISTRTTENTVYQSYRKPELQI